MTSPAPTAQHPLQPSLRLAHRGVLAWLALCAVVSALRWTPDEPVLEAGLMTPAVVLAVATVLTRRLGTSPVMAARGRAIWTFLAYAFAAALGALATSAAVNAGTPRTALVLIVGAVLFSLPPPPVLPAE